MLAYAGLSGDETRARSLQRHRYDPRSSSPRRCREVVGDRDRRQRGGGCRKKLPAQRGVQLPVHPGGHPARGWPAIDAAAGGGDHRPAAGRAWPGRCVAQVLRLAPPRIVYVSCNPATLARDLAMLKRGYEVLEIQPLRHVSAHLSRRSRSHDWQRDDERQGRPIERPWCFHAGLLQAFTSDDPGRRFGRPHGSDHRRWSQPHVELVQAESAAEAQIARRSHGARTSSAFAASGSTTSRRWPPAAPSRRQPSALRSPALPRSARPATTPRPAPAGGSAFSTTWRWRSRR
ncbi:MAG: hypothetical protein MZV70_76085 [Desulfobacterales bacterium]|nr:hypothetical protein [Desulfobacterales bacterium]